MADRRVALITGGGTGIGAAVARRLAADGCAVAVTGRRPEPIEAVAAEVGGLAIQADTAGGEAAERAVAETVDRFDSLDALVLNAGRGAPGSLLDADSAKFEAVWLLSPEASYVNGAVLTADGGSTAVDVAAIAFADADA